MKLKYKVVEQCGKDELAVEVEKLTGAGWKLQGGVSASIRQSGVTSSTLEVGYLQALTYKGK